MAAAVYARLRSGESKIAPIDVKMTVGPPLVGPKSLGGNAWKSSKEYAEVLSRPAWRDPGYSVGFSPCIAYGWIAVQIKVIPARYSADAMRLQLLNVVDYDLDYKAHNDRGFENGFEMGARHACAPGTTMQGASFTGMISYDFQTYVRHIQQGWVGEEDGAFKMGPEDASPEEWAAVQVADCAALVPFAFETPEEYNRSRTGMITGTMQLQCHDLLFDIGCSNRITTIRYTEAAGVAQYGMTAAFAIGFFESIGKFLLDTLTTQGDEAVPPYGYSACMVAGPWNPFNTRYQAWERCVKYTRQLMRSKSCVAKSILDTAEADLVLEGCDLSIDAGDSWARAMKSDASALVKRTTGRYFISSSALELFDTPEVAQPELCTKCGPVFESVLSVTKTEEVHAIRGLPECVTQCQAARISAGIRRAALWASSLDCCDQCACKVGCWTDAIGYRVLSALMSSEPGTGRSTWCLQNYFVGAVTFWPVSLPYLLSTFDLVANISVRDGAMGNRDVVDI